MPFLTFNAKRRRPWVEHEHWPKGAIKWVEDENKRLEAWGPALRQTIDIYYMTSSRASAFKIDPKTWSVYEND